MTPDMLVMAFAVFVGYVIGWRRRGRYELKARESR